MQDDRTHQVAVGRRMHRPVPFDHRDDHQVAEDAEDEDDAVEEGTYDPVLERVVECLRVVVEVESRVDGCVVRVAGIRHLLASSLERRSRRSHVGRRKIGKLLFPGKEKINNGSA